MSDHTANSDATFLSATDEDGVVVDALPSCATKTAEGEDEDDRAAAGASDGVSVEGGDGEAAASATGFLTPALARLRDPLDLARDRGVDMAFTSAFSAAVSARRRA